MYILKLIKNYIKNVKENLAVTRICKELYNQGLIVNGIMFFNGACLVSIVDDDDTDEMKSLLGFGDNHFDDVARLGNNRIVAVNVYV